MSLNKASVNLLDELIGYVPTEVLAQDDDILPSGAPAAVDHILLMRVGAKFSANKTITVNADGTVDVKPYHCGTYFDPLALPVSDLPTMHAQCVRICEGLDGVGYIVGGNIAPEARSSITRAKSYKPAGVDNKGRKTRATPRGLVDGPRHWLICDLDKIANVLCIDPRRDPDAATAFLRSLFPATMQEAGFSWQWSSSTCVKGTDGRPLAEDAYPQTLGAHFRFWLSRPLTETERKSLLNRIRLHVAAVLEKLGVVVEIGARVVDPQVGVFNQAVYTCRPAFDGMADPFAADRRYGLIGGTGTVDVQMLLGELPASVTMSGRSLTDEQRAARKLARTAAVNSVRVKAPQKWQREPLEIEVTPLQNTVSDLLHERLNALLAGRRDVATCGDIWRCRFLIELPFLVADRRENDDAWRAAGGVPEGMRNTVMMLASSALSYLFNPGVLYQLTRDLCAPLVSGGLDYIESEWAGSSEYAVVRRAVDDADGIVPPDYVKNGISYSVKDSRYGYWKTTTIDLLAVTEKEMITLGLEALGTETIRHYHRRREMGLLTMAEKAEKAAANRAAIKQHCLDNGISRSTYYDRLRRQKPAGSPLKEFGVYGDEWSLQEMNAAGLPVHDDTPLYQRSEMHDICAITTLAVNPKDFAAFEWIAPKFGMSADAVALVAATAEQEFVPVHQILFRHSLPNNVGPGSKSAMSHLAHSLESLAFAGRSSDDPSRILRQAFNAMGYAALAICQPDAPVSLRNSLNSAIAMAVLSENIAEFVSGFKRLCGIVDGINASSVVGQSDTSSSGLSIHAYSEMDGGLVGWRGSDRDWTPDLAPDPDNDDDERLEIPAWLVNAIKAGDFVETHRPKPPARTGSYF
jgi:hypothetical protein